MGNKEEKILEWMRNKKKKVTLQFNPEFWEEFKKACSEDGKKPIEIFERCMLKYLEEKGKL